MTDTADASKVIAGIRPSPLAAYETFFQSLWVAPVEGAGERRLGFLGTASAFSLVIRDVDQGRPIACYTVDLVCGAATVDLTSVTANEKSVVLYLFGTLSDAERFAEDVAKGWTKADELILEDPDLLHMIPDVTFIPQLKVRVACEACNPQNSRSVEEMNAKLDLIYAGFTEYDGHALPDVREGIKGVTIAAPGNPPEWIPPD